MDSSLKHLWSFLMFTQMQVLERLLMIYIQMSRPLLFLITNCRTWRDWSGCLEQHKLSDAPIKRDRPLHCNEKSPHWRCNTIRTARHPFEWTSSHSWLQLISESSWWNRIILWNTNQQRKYIFQTSPNHQVGSPQRDSPNKTHWLRLVTSTATTDFCTTSLVACHPNVQPFYVGSQHLVFLEGHMTLKHRE